MANVLAPFGFQYFGRQEGGSPTEGQTVRLISSADTVAVGRGDVMIPLNTGFVTAGASGTTITVAGVLYGVTYVSTTLQKQVWANYWPGSGSAGDVTAYLTSDPQALFLCQTDGSAGSATPAVFSAVGLNINFASAAPNSATQLSTEVAAVSTIATTSTHPFRIVGLYSDFSGPGAPNGSDNSTAFNWIVVTGNNWDRKQPTGV